MSAPRFRTGTFKKEKKEFLVEEELYITVRKNLLNMYVQNVVKY